MTVFPIMPTQISRLYELAYNLWWSWHPEARSLYCDLNPELWEAVGHSPVRFLSEVEPNLLEQAANDDSYLERYNRVLATFDRYMHPRQGETWFSHTYPEFEKHSIAYFSAEFGLHEALPIYSGGLGILAGDHLKSASDLGIPLVGVGLYYDQGYFRQWLDRDGVQHEDYIDVDHRQLPIQPALRDGEPITIAVETRT